MYENDLIPDRSELTISKFAELAYLTNKLKPSIETPLDMSMLGFFGEAGSLLSAVKKETRDDLPTDKYYDAVEEELGDFLWYFSSVCRVVDLDLEEVVKAAAIKPVRRSAGIRFLDVEKQFHRSRRAPRDRLIAHLIGLAGDIGDFTSWQAHNRTNRDAKIVKGYLAPIMRGLFRAAAMTKISIHDAAIGNLMKTMDRWPIGTPSYPDLYDEDHTDNTELLPRKISIRIEERKKRGKNYVFQSSSGLYIGDPLTDNIGDEDYYRFHDVFHYAYTAILGWSPVTRALLKLKRKSDPKLDENQDGARAILIEEGISTLVFNYAKDLRYFEDVKRGELSFELLRTVRSFVNGYEVESAPLWLWEEAILAGFKCFRFLKTEKKGIVMLDMNKRTIEITKIKK